MRASAGSLRLLVRMLGCVGVFVGSFAATMAMTSAERAVSDASPAIVERTLKGDRLPFFHDASTPRVGDPKLPDGCVEASKAPKSIYTTEIAGRCLV